MMIVGINEAAKMTGLSVKELRKGVKIGKYPFLRTSGGGKNTAYKFDCDLLLEEIKKECLKNAEEQKQRVSEEYDRGIFIMPRIAE